MIRTIDLKYVPFNIVFIFTFKYFKFHMRLICLLLVVRSVVLLYEIEFSFEVIGIDMARFNFSYQSGSLGCLCAAINSKPIARNKRTNRIGLNVIVSLLLLRIQTHDVRGGSIEPQT